MALLESLPQLHAYLVQVEKDRFRLHVECDREEEELLAELLAGIQAWLRQRSLAATVVEVADRAAIVQPAEQREETSQLVQTLLSAALAGGRQARLPALEQELRELLPTAIRRRPQPAAMH